MITFQINQIIQSILNEGEHPYVNSVTSGDVGPGDLADQIKEGIINGFTWLGESIVNTLIPFVEWGCKFIIIGCVVVFFCGHEKKYISSAVKFALIFVLFCALGGAIT